MKILTVAHRFPPRHETGAELYALGLARELATRHEVFVYAADDNLGRRNYSRRTYDVDGIKVIEVINHRLYRDFAESYADPRMEMHFRAILRAIRPDIIHFQHLLHHSIDYPLISRELGIPSVVTLHEYWFICGRNGQMIQSDDSRCMKPGLEKCADCLSRFMWGRTGVDVWALRGIEGVRKVTGLDLKAAARRLRMRRVPSAEEELDPEDHEEMKKETLVREARMRDMFEMVDCFVAPSAFLRERFIEFGLDSQRVLHSDYGTEVRRFDVERELSDGRIRVGFLGSVQHVKGVHVLLAALERLDPSLFIAHVYGDLSTKPEYVASLKAQAPGMVELHGRVPAASVPAALAGLDVLVVPSIWWENSPLVIHEAFAAGLPVVCSAIGGMVELVEHGVNGLHFRAGDDEDLARQLTALVADHDLLNRLRLGVGHPKTMEEDARFHEALFETVLNSVE